MSKDPERDRLAARMGRIATVGANVAGAAAAVGAARLFGGDDADRQMAVAIKAALGRSKGPLMKVAQIMATIPDLLPKEFADELAQLQTNAPSMGWPFVQRRMRGELGADWDTKFKSFEREAIAAASLGQVHRATGLDGAALACKLQYPEMASAVEADITQLNNLVGVYRRFGKVVDPSEITIELTDRLREELDYEREARHMALYRRMLADHPEVRVPEPIPALSTKRLLTMTWLDGRPLRSFLDEPQAVRNRIAELLFQAWWGPMAHYGVIHGDPHLGNYTFTDGAAQLNLLDFGCVRIFPPRFVLGVVRLYRALQRDDMDAVAEAYRDWGFGDLSRPAVEALTIWARFIYAPMLDDRVRTAADGVAPGEYGRKEIMRVKDELQAHGPVKVPREFVFMDRAAIGLGAAFLHLRAELNFYEMFNAQIDGFDVDAVKARQVEAVGAVGLEPG
ncbi:MAG: AarF/ABC1/UbiB kinase family protein [Alphaproteobacteria bacterium]|nr:AarF/ABC1/UbiB kinase family protein [Alphaproteobacteria bacterium]